MSTPEQLKKDLVKIVALFNRDDYDRAMKECSAALRRAPDAHPFWNARGAIHMRRGEFELAGQCFTKAISLNNRNPEYHRNLGVACEKVGDFANALKSQQNALQLNPNLYDSCLAAGLALRRLQRFEDAENMFIRAAKIDPKDARAHVGLAGSLLDQKLNERAEEEADKALDLDPESIDAKIAKAVCLIERKDPNRAEVLLREVLAVDPANAAAQTNLSKILIEDGRFDEATSLLDDVLDRDPNNTGARLNLAGLFQIRGSNENAFVHYDRILRADPNNFEALVQIATTLVSRGEIDLAVDGLRKALRQRPDSAKALFHLLATLESSSRIEELEIETVRCRKKGIGWAAGFGEALLLMREKKFEKAVETLQRLQSDGLPSECERRVQFLLGEAFDRLGDADRAIEHFHLGNDKARSSHLAAQGELVRYRKAVEERLELLRAKMDSGERWTGLADLPPATKSEPVFVFGFPRSGTTLVDTILRGHSKLAVFEERPFAAQMRAAIQADGKPETRLVEALTARERQIALKQFEYMVERFRSADGHALGLQGRSLVDKSPLNGVQLDVIHSVFPHARLVFCLRHPLDVILSCYMQNFTMNAGMSNFTRLEDAARLYDVTQSFYLSAKAYFGLEVHYLRYENLISSYDETVKGLISFLGLEWEEGLGDHTASARQRDKVRTASYNQVVEPIYDRSMQRWKRYEKALEPVLPIMGPWVKHFGYDL